MKNNSYNKPLPEVILDTEPAKMIDINGNVIREILIPPIKRLGRPDLYFERGLDKFGRDPNTKRRWVGDKNVRPFC